MMASDAWLEVKPFLTGTRFGVDQATVQITTFTTMVNRPPLRSRGTGVGHWGWLLLVE